MKKNYFKVLIVGSFLLLFSLQSCVHEGLETEVANVQQDPVYYIKNEYMKGKDIVAGKLIEWEKARKYKKEGEIIFVTVPVKNEGNNLIEELSFRIDNTKVSGHVWKFKSDSPFTDKDYSLTAHEIMAKMTGTVSYTSLEGSMRYEKKIVRGELIDEVSKNGSGPMSSPSCKPCHGQIDEIVIPAPGSGTPTNPFPNNPIPGGVGGSNPQNPQNPDNPQNNDPCKKIKEKQENPKYAEKFNSLNKPEIFNMDKEKGYYEKQPPIGVNVESSFVDVDGPPGTTGLDLPDNTTAISGLLHTHNNVDGSIKIFSPTDVATFLNTLLKNAGTYGGGYGNAYTTVVTSQGSYTLKFNGTVHPGGADYYVRKSWDKWYETEMAKIADKDGVFSQNKVEDVFSRFLKEVVNKAGLEVFRVTANTASKLNYDPITKEAKADPCP